MEAKTIRETGEKEMSIEKRKIKEKQNKLTVPLFSRLHAT